MMSLAGLELIDLIMIAGYFAAVLAIGFWASRKVKNEDDFFLGGRKFGAGLLTMHWLCTGTHSEMAVQVAGATARVGLGGIWYQWMWLFSTPFYWLIAPITRRLRVTTTGDFFRIRYGKSLEMLYALVALFYFALSIALLLRGAGAAISGATGGAIPTHASVIVLSILFSTYVMAGGLVAAAYTDVLQGLLIIALSVLLVPAGLGAVGGLPGLREKLAPSFFAITAPQGAQEGDPWFVVTMSILGLVGVVVQPHVMTATGSGKTETEARVGMVYGNFIKRLLTIAWAFTGLIALAAFPHTLAGLDPNSQHARQASETLFGQAIKHFLGDGWRGLMIACLIAGVTSAETFMVGGSALFTRNFYAHALPNRSHAHYLWVGRAAAGGLLALGIVLALTAESVTQLVLGSVKVVGLLGAAFWLGVVWRRASAAGVWASFVGSLGIWGLMNVPTARGGVADNAIGGLARLVEATAGALALRGLSEPQQILIMLATQFGLLVLVSLCTRPLDLRVIGPFYARIHTPVGKEDEVRWDDPPHDLPEAATIGLEGVVLDYGKSSRFAYRRLQELGLEIPRLSWFDWGGFLAAWVMVGGLIGLLTWLAGLGSR
jgi:Na+/proline symporter